MLDYSKYLDADWKADCYMGDETDTVRSILMCEFNLLQNMGKSIDELPHDHDPMHLTHYLPFDHTPTDREIFDHLAYRLDTIPSWYPSWITKMDGLTLDPPHYYTEHRNSIATWSKRRNEIISQRKHKEVMRTEMYQAWVFNVGGDLFGACIKPRYINAFELEQGMPGGRDRCFWALKEPHPLTEDPWPEDTGKDDWKLERLG